MESLYKATKDAFYNSVLFMSNTSALIALSRIQL